MPTDEEYAEFKQAEYERIKPAFLTPGLEELEGLVKDMRAANDIALQNLVRLRKANRILKIVTALLLVTLVMQAISLLARMGVIG